MRALFAIALATLIGSSFPAGAGQLQRLPGPDPVLAPTGTPLHVVDLMTDEGAAVVGARWRFSDVTLAEVPARRNAGKYKTTLDVVPHAGPAEFDDSAWEVIEPKALGERRGGGRLFMCWFRTAVTLPAKIGAFDTTGTTAVFHVVVDDYGEVWANGDLARQIGMPSGNMINGFNMPNRVIISPAVKPGERVTLAVFVVNGPISLAPENPAFIREARLEFHRATR